MCVVLAAAKESCEVMEKEVARLDQLNKDLKATCQQLQATVDDLSRCSFTCPPMLCSFAPLHVANADCRVLCWHKPLFQDLRQQSGKLGKHCVYVVTGEAGEEKST